MLDKNPYISMSAKLYSAKIGNFLAWFTVKSKNPFANKTEIPITFVI